MSAHLLPCPFCGDGDEKGRMEVTIVATGEAYTRITCRLCGAMCPAHNWNRRNGIEADQLGEVS